MNSEQNVKLLTALAMVMALVLAPVSTVAFAQTEDTEPIEEEDLPVEQNNAVDEEIDETETDEETDEEKKYIRDEIKDKIRQFKEETRDKIRELKEDRKQKIQDMRKELADKYSDRIRPDLNTDVRPYEMPDREPDLYFKGEVDGFAMFGGYAYDSSTWLSGEAYHVRGSMWKVHVTDGAIQIGDRSAELELKGFAKGHRLALHGTATTQNGDQIRVAFMGYFAPTHEEGEFALALTKLGYHTEHNSGRVHLAQVGEVYVEPNPDLPEPVPLPEPAPIEIPAEIPL